MSRGTDEWLDAVLCRPIARRVAARLDPTPVTPNGVTLVAGLVGASAGAAFVLPSPGPAAGAALLLAMMVLDCVDGELARRRGGGGWRGRILDGLADLATAVALHVGMLVHLSRLDLHLAGHPVSPLELFLLTAAAGASMSWNAAVVDDVKQRLKGGSVDDELDRHAADVQGPVDRLLYAFLRRYVRYMRRATGPGRPGGEACFCHAQWVGPTHHHLAIAVAAACTLAWPPAFAVYLLIAILPANLWLLTVLAAHRRSNDV